MIQPNENCFSEEAACLAEGGPILVTGGAGFIGSNTVKRLLDLGCEVRVLDDLSVGTLSALPVHSKLTFHQGDIRDSEAVARAMIGVSRVLHLAAQVSTHLSLTQPVDSASRNILGFIQILEAARKFEVKRLVFASSAAVYGVHSVLANKETTPRAPVSPYGLEKCINEDYARIYYEHHGLSFMALRYFNVYGPGQPASSPYSGVLSIFRKCIGTGEKVVIFGDGEQTRDFIHVETIAEVNCRALASSMTGPMNVATGTRHSLNQVLAIFESTLGHPLLRTYLPARKEDILHSCADVSLMRRLFGQLPILSLEEGLSSLL